MYVLLQVSVSQSQEISTGRRGTVQVLQQCFVNSFESFKDKTKIFLGETKWRLALKKKSLYTYALREVSL